MEFRTYVLLDKNGYAVGNEFTALTRAEAFAMADIERPKGAILHERIEDEWFPIETSFHTHVATVGTSRCIYISRSTASMGIDRNDEVDVRIRRLD